MASLSGAEVLIETLKGNGVEHIFGCGGSALLPIHDSLLDHRELKYLMSLHEMCTVAMADGYARASGKVGFAMVHVAVGAANAMGALLAAQRDKTPLVVLAGERETQILGRRSYNESLGPLPDAVRPFVKWSWQIQRADKIAEEVNKGFKIAKASPAGPVFLSLPMDMMTEQVDAKLPFSATCDVSPTIRGNEQYVLAAAAMLAKAERPVILMGSGVGHSRASQEVVLLGEAIGAPIFLERNSFVIDFPRNNPLFGGYFSFNNPLVKNTDLLVVIGGRTEIEMHYHPGVSHEFPKIIQITTEAEEIGLVHHVDVGLIADPKEALKDILTVLKGEGSRLTSETVRTRIKSVGNFMNSRRDAVALKIKEHWNSKPLSPSRVLQALAEVADGDPVVVGISASGGAMAATLVNAPTVFSQNGVGYLGWGLPASLGISVAMPKKRVICVIGDGGFMFGPQALWTAARYGIPVFTLVLSNRSYVVDRSEKMIQRKAFIGTELGNPDMDFAKMGQSMGVKSFRITEAKEITDVFNEAWKLKEPVIVDAVVSDEMSSDFL